MHRHANLIACIFFLGVSGTGSADDGTGGYFEETLPLCLGPSDPSLGPLNDHFRCVGEAKKEADRELDATYQRLTKAADEQEKRYLEAMQKAWVALRDAQCGLGMYYRKGGTHLEAWKEECETVMTFRRIRELNQLGTGILWNKGRARVLP